MKEGYKPKIEVYTSDRYLFQKIKLDLIAEYDCILASEENEREASAIAIWDTALGAPPEGYAFITVGGEGDVPLPLPLGALSRSLSGKLGSLEIFREGRRAVVDGRTVRLTELEFNLLSSLYEYGGEYVSREELLRSVWGEGEVDGGILNVYVHYLREKLEKNGEKIILSSRKSGYCINKRYLGGKENA